jgi:hypothetical protein
MQNLNWISNFSLALNIPKCKRTFPKLVMTLEFQTRANIFHTVVFIYSKEASSAYKNKTLRLRQIQKVPFEL